ncbi:sulfotransferase [Rhabdothermincola sp.]|uniref:sulfotransferase n=1 Tax=Rhabdothermincola sp. TaxID=2820405 RepID=UPI002FE2AEFC
MAARTPTLVHVIGTPRGGTHIVGRVIGALPGALYGGELTSLWRSLRRDPDLRCACGDRTRACPVWADATDLAPAELDRLFALQRQVAPSDRSWRRARAVLRRLDAGDEPTDAEARYLRRLESRVQVLARANDARLVVDVSKNPTDAVLTSLAGTIDTLVVHVVRDPRGVVNSVRRRGKAGPGTDARVALAWLAQHTTVARIGDAIGPRYVPVSYEAFCADPETALAPVLDQLALAGSDFPDTASPDCPVFFHNPAPGVPGGRQGIQVRLDDRWRRELPAASRLLVRSLTWPWRAGETGRRERSGQPPRSDRLTPPPPPPRRARALPAPA